MPAHSDINDQWFLAPRTANLLVYSTPGKSRLPGAVTYVFTDNRGSCYRKAVLTRDGALDDAITGKDCPNGANHVRWYANPDRSANRLSWQRP